MPLFILDPYLCALWAKSEKRLGFYFQSLISLDSELRKIGASLIIRLGDPVEEIGKLLSSYSIVKVFLNSEHTPFGRSRDKKIKRVCEREGVEVVFCQDSYLNPPGSVTKDDGSPYTVFTPYHKKASKCKVTSPLPVQAHFFEAIPSRSVLEIPQLARYQGVGLPGFEPGFSGAKVLMAKAEKLYQYAELRDMPAIDSTTKISPYLRFGVVSPRQVYYALGDEKSEFTHLIRRQLFWRDFYAQIGWHYPNVYRKCFRQKFESIRWENNEDFIDLWKAGRTGFPIVDAGMRELNHTGFMHGRVRMVTASFLVKNLHVDWRIGLRYFAEKLIDYDPAVNNGNWQWVASTGCDPQPYFRVFNPWRQQKKFDPECVYIKRWVHELATCSAKDIHSLEKTNDIYLEKIVDLRETSEQIKLWFKEAGQQ
ncbi:MAG: deoxyribodipyrimidine photolyase [Gammaproteobacteria bacterium]|nr:deoxyribodipyrimidine photolyase [Gammaproteobacteria bacterium]